MNRPFWSSCNTIALALTGHLSGLDAVDSVPGFSARVCEVDGFNCLYPTLFTFLIQALDHIDQDDSCVFRPLTGCCGCVVFLQLLAFFFPAWDVLLLVTTGN